MAARSQSGSTELENLKEANIVAKASAFWIASVTLDEDIAQRTAEIEQEKKVAIHDLLVENHFEPSGSDGGPYHLLLSIAENRLVFDVRLDDERAHGRYLLSLTPFRRVLKDYHQLCDNYYLAIREAPPARIEAIDMGRRGLHDEGSRILRERLEGKIDIDFETARRLFTLISALHLKA
jgi:uncharacterized protein (UPF0262 family)